MFRMAANYRIISVLFLTYSSLSVGLWSAPAAAQAVTQKVSSAPIELADNVPDQHVVVTGDTLWGIASLFLKQPYRWPEIWRLNKEQIRNPHRIYPGQIVYLDRSGDQPQLRLGKPVGQQLKKAGPQIYSEANKQREIPSIPQNIIEPFLSEPLVVEADGLDRAARIVATQEDRVNIGTGNLAYVVGLTAENVKSANGRPWQIYRPGKPLIDPETGEVLGNEAFYLGSARVVRAAELATVEVTKAREEIGLNDRLLPAPAFDMINYVPHAPEKAVNGRVMSIYGGVNEGGTNSIVTLSRGKKDGIEIGHVLRLSRAGAQARNVFDGKATVYQLPEEQYGMLFVFRVFERVSYALVMNVTRPVVVGDSVTTP